MRYLLLFIWTANVWAMSCEQNLGKLPAIRHALHRLEMLQQLADAGIGTAPIQPVKDQLLSYEEILKRDEPLSSEEMRGLDVALAAADNLRMTNTAPPSEVALPSGSRSDMYDRRFGKDGPYN